MALLDYLKQKLSVKSETETKQTYAEEKVKARRQMIGSLILVIFGIIFFTIVFDKTPRKLNESYINIHDAKTQSNSGSYASADKVVSQTDGDLAVSQQKEMLKNLFASKPQINSTGSASHEPATGSLEPGKPSNQSDVIIKKDSSASVNQTKLQVSPSSSQNSKQIRSEPVKKIDEEKRKNDARRAQDILNGKKMVVQIGAFSDPIKAKAMQLKAEQAGVNMVSILSSDKSVTRVRTRVLNNVVDAEEITKKLQRAGLDAQIIRFKD